MVTPVSVKVNKTFKTFTNVLFNSYKPSKPSIISNQIENNVFLQWDKNVPCRGSGRVGKFSGSSVKT